MRSILSRILPRSPERILTEQLNALRRVEVEHPYLPRFDECSLPARAKGQSEIAWREAQLDALQVWVRDVTRIAEDLHARGRFSSAGGVA